MKIEVRKSSLVRPKSTTPLGILWNSNIDNWAPSSYVLSVMFYRPSSTVTEETVLTLKEALSRVLVPFYPMAGRLKTGSGGRNNIDCNAEGVLFVEAESDGSLDDFGDFSPSSDTRLLVPPVDSTLDICTLPLSFLQVTSFKCGGISIGVATSHQIADGISGVHFINSWSDLARGLDDIKVPPHFDRTHLRAGEPPQPQFDHIEYQPPPTFKIVQQNGPPDKVVFSFLKITRHQLNILKDKSKENVDMVAYSSFVTLAAHIWRCVCKARDLHYKDQETNLYITIDGRSRLQPTLPPGFFGNVIFPIAANALTGDIESKSLNFVASKIQNAIIRRDNEYLRSAIDYLELQPDLTCAYGQHYFKSPNFSITSWLTLPLYDADFGWGKPIFVGPGGGVPREGKCHIMRNPINDGSLFISISLPSEKIKLFEKLLYDI